jgi:hypothetical protein
MEVGFAVLSDELAGWRAGFLRSSCEPLAAGRCARMLDFDPNPPPPPPLLSVALSRRRQHRLRGPCLQGRYRLRPCNPPPPPRPRQGTDTEGDYVYADLQCFFFYCIACYKSLTCCDVLPHTVVTCRCDLHRRVVTCCNVSRCAATCRDLP